MNTLSIRITMAAAAALLFTAVALPAAKDDAPPAAAPAGGRDAELVAASKNNELVKQGREAYANFCKSCHGEEKGQTSDAPSNLFDAKWYHGGKPSEVEHTVLTGVMEKGMPGWGEVLPAEDTTALTAYLLSFQKSS